MVISKTVFTLTKKFGVQSNNSFAITVNNTFVQITSFIVDSERSKEYTIRNLVNIQEIFDDDSSDMKKIVNVSRASMDIESSSIKAICVTISTKKKS